MYQVAIEKLYRWKESKHRRPLTIDTGEQIMPLEVRAEIDLKAKSLKSCREKFNPEISARTSMADYIKEERLVGLPLYALDGICSHMALTRLTLRGSCCSLDWIKSRFWGTEKHRSERRLQSCMT